MVIVFEVFLAIRNIYCMVFTRENYIKNKIREYEEQEYHNKGANLIDDTGNFITSLIPCLIGLYLLTIFLFMAALQVDSTQLET